MKEYFISVDSTLRVEASNEDELHEKALQQLFDMVNNRQVDFTIEDMTEKTNYKKTRN